MTSLSTGNDIPGLMSRRTADENDLDLQEQPVATSVFQALINIVGEYSNIFETLLSRSLNLSEIER